ncbi:MAG TPA: HAMP domain-containing sensor histidine kinase [Aggregatilinea sp.]|uniref:sensor histidine kinase n=1 Tax=Aggregatilinea sp. TaxID=2806333 RepID=UPI002C45A20A|nr:HAMP domain-containing sensor histidine kinase [Aggregatilinea sp.]HML21125.1 HAMP domain-containing sensor histidine kinase [Aggregatilinea sp.]
MNRHSLRIRLLATYTGLIVLGFGVLALLAGQQLSNAARRDYELRLSNEVVLVARGFEEATRPSQVGETPDEDDLDEILQSLNPRADTEIKLYKVDSQPPVVIDTERDDTPDRRDHTRPDGEEPVWPLPDNLKDFPEIVSANRNTIIVDQRDNADGESTLYTAAPIKTTAFNGYIQLSEPASVLNQAIRQRWETLIFGLAVITTLALLASIWLARSLIRPLENLRDSALRLSQGELSHRITDQRQDELGAVALAFNQMATRVQAMIEEQRAFASNTSHELRTPLTTMRLRTEALRFDKELDAATVQQYVGELDDELVRLSALVDDLVLLSRFDAQRAEIGQEEIDLARFAHSLIQAMSQQAKNHSISLELNVEGDEPLVVNASLTHLTVLFRNILDNAIKYTPAGGSVTWRVWRDDAAVVLSVTDTGQGISPEQIGHVFERFYRADRARSRSIPGTGLGLALAQSIVETYSGTIEAASPGIGQGTTIAVRWPLA